jgi:hypothetical protein
MGINWSSAYEAGMAEKTAASVPVATPAAAVAAAPAVATPVQSGAAGLFDGLVGASNSRATFGSATTSSGAAGDSYVGNFGNPYGSNIIKAPSTSGYDFTATFVNTQSNSITVNCWNKVGSDGQPLSGSALAPKDTSLTFILPAGASQVVAFMPDSQVGCAQSCSETAESGAFATTWFEANFQASGSGYDVSAIMNSAGNNYAMSITSLEAPACTSDMNQNMWLTATDQVGSGSCYIAQSTATMKVVMGGTV